MLEYEYAKKASKDEIIRRYLNSLLDLRNGKVKRETCDKIALLMHQLNINVSDRKCVKAALEKRDIANTVSMAIELTDGTIIASKTSDLLSAPAALILNALKHLAGINDELLLISPAIIEPISEMKIKHLGNKNKFNIVWSIISIMINNNLYHLHRICTYIMQIIHIMVLPL